MGNVKTEIVHFTITGEFMTDIARDLLLEDEPGKAYRIIADHLIGESAAQAALCVLKGTHNLAGDSSSDTGIFVVKVDESDEDILSFHKSFQRLYAGRHRHNGAWRRPVARVVGFNKDDAAYASSRVAADLIEDLEGRARWNRARTQYYCGPGETVGDTSMKLPDGGKAWIIWEPCGEMPHWVKPNITEQEAFDEWVEARRAISVRKCEEPEPDRFVPTMARPFDDGKTDEEREAEYDEEDRRFAERCLEIGERVRAQAGDDTIVLELAGRKLTIPRAPFARWSLSRVEGSEMPDWNTISPIGMKMTNDDPNHTDWVLGSGLTLEEAYEDEMKKASWEALFEFQRKARKPKPFAGIMAAYEMLSDTIHEAGIMVDAGERTGVVGEDIMVLPDSDAARVAQLGKSIGVIVEKGGRLAHFAIVTRGRGITVMRHPDACDLFTPGMRVTLSPKTGRIVIAEED